MRYTNLNLNETEIYDLRDLCLLMCNEWCYTLCSILRSVFLECVSYTRWCTHKNDTQATAQSAERRLTVETIKRMSAHAPCRDWERYDRRARWQCRTPHVRTAMALYWHHFCNFHFVGQRETFSVFRFLEQTTQANRKRR